MTSGAPPLTPPPHSSPSTPYIHPQVSRKDQTPNLGFPLLGFILCLECNAPCCFLFHPT